MLLPEGLVTLLLSCIALLPAASSSRLDKRPSSFLEDVLSSNAANQHSCKPTGLIQDACCDFETIESVNQELHQQLEHLVTRPYFRYWKVDLYRECPFWDDASSICGNQACAVQEVNEAHIPVKWQTQSLSQLQRINDSVKDMAFTDELGSTCYFRDSDFCQIEDNQLHSSDLGAFYVDLLENPERFTGYAGKSAHNVWKAIYEENCFDPPTVSTFFEATRGRESGGSGFAHVRQDQNSLGGTISASKSQASWKGQLLSNLQGPRDTQEQEECLEKRVYYRLISGLHASISIHICDEYLDQTTGQWQPNLDCFISRIGEHPERLQNVYFDYVLMLRALSKASEYLKKFDLSTGNASEDEQTRSLVSTILDRVDQCEPTFDETNLFTGQGAEELKDEFKHHFRNVSRIMDCVGCDKCRLWGGLQVTGLGTALKLLFGTPEDSPSDLEVLNLQRSEIVAFFNTLHRLSQSLSAIEKFRELWAQRDAPLDLGSSGVAVSEPESQDEPITIESASVQVDETVKKDVESSIAITSAGTQASSDSLPRPTAALPTRRRPPPQPMFPSRPQKKQFSFPPQKRGRNLFLPAASSDQASGRRKIEAGEWMDKLVRICQSSWTRCFKYVCIRLRLDWLWTWSTTEKPEL